MILRYRPTLRRLLTLPYVLLVLATAAVIALLSYRAGSDAVDALADIALHETVDRITQAVERHVAGSEAVLETAFPADVPAPVSVAAELDRLRERLWLATTIHRDPNNYAYYGDRRGQFIGLWRFSETEAELRLRTDPDAPRSIYRFSRIQGDLGEPVAEERIFDPRERPWFRAGQSESGQTWTSIYIDFKTLELVGTRARRVNGVDGQFEGVVATDMSLGHLDDFLETLSLTEHGVAFVVERNGDLLAASRGPHMRKGVGDDNGRLNAARSDDALVAATYLAARELIGDRDHPIGTRTVTFDGADGQTVQAGFSRLRDEAGLDWIVAVATPRSDYLGSVRNNVYRTAAMAFAACAVIVLIGLFVLHRIAADLRRLAYAAQRMGEGDHAASVPTERDDEIGELAKAFARLQTRLLTDRLSGLANREALLRRLEGRIARDRREGSARPFAVLFVDLDRFKPINDRFGHDAGDRVLKEVAARIAGRVGEPDLASRFGGDEFVILLDEVDGRADALAAADTLRLAMAEPYETIAALGGDAAAYSRGASIGVALCPDDGRDIETLMRRADARMYERKGVPPRIASR